MRKIWPLAGAKGPSGRGFTLIEMLVTLLIVSMISALLWQAMQQVYRVERVLQSSGAEGQLQIVRREWLRSLIEATLPGQQNAPQFRGTASELWFISAEAANVPGLGSGQLHLAIHHDRRTDRSSLTLQSMAGGPQRQASLPQPTAEAPITLLSWTGPAVGLRYLDASGKWLDDWMSPDLGVPGPSLPKVVLINFGDVAGGPLVVAITSTERPRMLRADWERK